MTELLKYIELEDGREMVVLGYQLRDDNSIREEEWDDYDNCTTTVTAVARVLNVYYLHASAALCVDERGNEVVDYDGFPEYSYVVLVMDDRGNTLYSDSGIRSANSKYADYNDTKFLEYEVIGRLDMSMFIPK